MLVACSSSSAFLVHHGIPRRRSDILARCDPTSTPDPIESKLCSKGAARAPLYTDRPTGRWFCSKSRQIRGVKMKPPPDLRVHLIDLRSKRRIGKRNSTRQPRTSLTAAERHQVLAKTSGRSHICGGEIEHDRWQADHVMAHSAGGNHDVDNYLPAHSICNNYRWDYLPEEFRYILKLGVRARTQIERGTIVGNDVASAFAGHETRRVKRRI
jgi:5-methylcytosine-specific restriction endonuclease McrA